ncbi:tetratricopeptide repeat protein [Salidesulfovibrio onnuriiensis]|uniref:tetratricopeptide repeat protein n=1 Tax=Salidesulfovibrio onnuriiensis TaxID=2583823 RepID=UPI0011C8A9C7|nr:tetratricopeptide repeat protein [Salidesulfovibrio onnuriiensis]
MATSVNLAGRKLLLAGVFLCLAAMFATSVAYRVNHPELVKQFRPKQTAPQGMQGMGMGAIRDMMAKAEAEPENVDNLMSLSNAFLMMQAWDRALVFLDKARVLEPDNVVILQSMGICYFRKQQYEHAVETYERILELESGNALAHYNLGVVFKHFLNDPESAATHFRAVVDLPHGDEEMKKQARGELKELGKL